MANGTDKNKSKEKTNEDTDLLDLGEIETEDPLANQSEDNGESSDELLDIEEAAKKGLIDPMMITGSKTEFSGLGELGEFDSLMPSGVGQQDLERFRARNQSTLSKIGRTAGNLLPNIGLGIIENAGYLGELANYGFKEITGQDDYKVDFSNALTEWSKDKANPFGDIHRLNKDEVFDLGDWAWWLEHGGSLVESISEFLATGAGVGLATKGTIGKLASSIAKSAKTAQGAQRISKGSSLLQAGITSHALSYTEGAISASEQYKQLIDQGVSPEEAAKAAATTATANTFLIGPLNMIGVMTMFKSPAALRRAQRIGLTPKSGETSKQFIKRLEAFAKNPDVDRPFMERFLLPLESAQESLEESLNLVSEDLGLQSIGKSDPKTFMETFTETVFTEEGALNAILGAIGGAGQAAGLTRLPVYQRTIENAEGEPETRWMSANQLQDVTREDMAVEYAKAIKSDIEEVLSLQTQLQEETQKENPNDQKLDRLRKQLFDISARRSIILDDGESIINTFNEMADVDNETDLGAQAQEQIKELEARRQEILSNKSRTTEELIEEGPDPEIVKINDQLEELRKQARDLDGVSPAMQAGLAQDMNDNQYQEEARKAVQETKDLAKLYEDTVNEFNFPDDQAFRLADKVFSMRVTKKRISDYMDDLRSTINKIESNLESDRKNLFGNKPEVERELNDLRIKLKALSKNRQELTEDIKNAKKQEVHMRKKHNLPADMPVEQALLEKRNRLDKEFIGTAGQFNAKTTKVSDKLFKDDLTDDEKIRALIPTLEQLENIDQKLVDLHANLEQARQQFSDVNQQLSKITSPDGAREFIKKAHKDLRETQKKLKKERDKEVSDEVQQRDKQKTEELKKTRKQTKGKKTDQEIEGFIREAGTQGKLDLIEDKFQDQIEANEDLSSLLDTRRQEIQAEIEEEVAEQEAKTKEPIPEDYDADIADLHIREDQDDAVEGIEDGDTQNVADTPADMFDAYDQAMEDILEQGREKDRGEYKVVDVNKLQYLSQAWDIISIDGQNIKVTDSNAKNENFNPIVESQREIQPGDKIFISLDQTYQGKHYDEQGEVVETSYSEILSQAEEGKEYYNVPIKIEIERDGERQLIGYVPTYNWVSAKYDNGVPKNVAPSIKGRPNNFEFQVNLIEQIREDIYKKGSVETQITGKSLGFVRFNFAEDAEGNIEKTETGRPKIEARKATELLPDPDLKFGYVQQGILREGPDTRSEVNNREAIEEGSAEGTIHALLADEMAIPVHVTTQTAERAETIWQMLKAKYDPNTEAHQDLESIVEELGSDLSSLNAVSDILSPFVYSRGRLKKEFIQNPEVPTGRVFIGFHKSGHVDIAEQNGLIYTTDRNRANQQGFVWMFESEQVEDAAKDLISRLRFSVKGADKDGNRLLNSKKEFKELRIAEDGTPEVITHQSYNEFIKENILTHVNGTHTINHGTEENPDLEYVYFNQPVIKFNMSFAIPENELEELKEQASKAPAKPSNVQDQSAQMDDLLPDEDAAEEISKEDTLDDLRRQIEESDAYKEGKEGKTLEDDQSEDDVPPDTSFFPSDVERTDEAYLPELRKALSKYSIEGFTPEQEMEVIDTLLYAASKRLFDEEKGVAETFDEVHQLVLNQLKAHMDRDEVQLAYYYKLIHDSWSKFEQRVVDKFGTLGIEFKVDDSYDSQEQDFSRTDFDSRAQWFEDRKDTASAQLKVFLSQIEDQELVRDEDGNPIEEDGRLKMKTKTNFLGRKKFIPFDEVYERLVEIFSERNPTRDNYEQILEEAARTNPYLHIVKERLKQEKQNLDSKLFSQFITAMSTQYLHHFLTLFNENKKAGGFDLRRTDSNVNSAIDSIYSEWLNNMKESKLVKEVDGDLIIDRELASKVKQRYTEAIKDVPASSRQAREIFRSLLEGIGVKMSDAAYSELVSRAKNKPEESPLTPSGKKGSSWGASIKLTQPNGKPYRNNFVSILFDSFGTDVAEDQDVRFNVGNPLASGSLNGVFRRLAHIEYKYRPRVYSPSFVNVDGKTVYAHQMNSMTSELIGKLNRGEHYLDQVLEDRYGRFSHWAKGLKDGSVTIQLAYSDGIKRRKSSFGRPAEELVGKDLDIYTMSLFHSTAAQTKGEQGTYLGQIKSDKDTIPLITAPRVNIHPKIEDGQVVHLNPVTDNEGKGDRISDAAIAEYRRVHYVQTLDEHPHTENLPKSFKEGGGNFIMHPFLNKERLEETHPQLVHTIYTDDGRVRGDNDAAIEAIRQITRENMTSEINSFLAELRSEGVVGGANTFLDVGYLINTARNYKDANDTHAYAVADFVVNSAIAKAEEQMLISGDPAYFWKGDVATTMKEYTKRLARDIAPRSDADWLADEQIIKAVVIGDDARTFTNEDLPPIYRTRKTEASDSQELVTVKEHVRTMRAHGQISPAEYNDLVKVIDNPDKDGYYEFTDEQLDIILQPQKPVYTGNKYDPATKSLIPYYIKSSNYPLLPQMTKGYDIDRLRVQMEKNNIDRAVFSSALKAGESSHANIFDSNGRIKENINLTDHTVELSRDGFGIQQEVPYKDKNQVTMVTQMNKLLFEGLRDVTGFTDPVTGSQITGRQLEERKEAVLKRMVENRRQQLLDRVGITFDEGEFQVEDFTLLKEALKKEAKRRKWPLNDIEALQLTEDKKNFIIPPAFSGSSTKIESIMLSMVSKTVTGLNITGKSFVQGTSSGFITNNDLTQNELRQVVTVEDFDSSKGLGFVERGEKSTKPAQVMIPWNFRDNEGNLLDINDFTKTTDDGRTVVDHDKLPKELLRMISSRIPNQGHNSMLPVEVVGFLPHNMGDLVIVPGQIVTQMGSDFDVDKLFAYQYEYYYDRNTGKIRQPRFTLDNHSRLYEQVYGHLIRKKEEINRAIDKFNEDIDKYDSLLEAVFTEIGLDSFENATDEEVFSMVLEDLRISEHQYKRIEEVPDKDEFMEKAKEDITSVLPAQALQQQFVDIHWTVLTNPKVFNKLTSPLDKDDLTKLREDLTGKESSNSMLYHRTQRNIRRDLKSGKDLVGQIALASVFNSIVQDRSKTNLKIIETDNRTGKKSPAPIEVSIDGNKVRLTTISGKGVSYFRGDKRSKQDNISLLLSAALDNANEGHLGPLNISQDTIGPALALAMLESDSEQALSLSYIIKLINQPIIKELTGRLSSERSVSQDQFRSETDIMEQAMEALEQAAQESLDSPVEDISQPLDEKELDIALDPEKQGSREAKIVQLKALSLFERLSDVAGDISTITRGLISPTTNGTGTTIFQLMSNITAFEQATKVRNIDNVSKLLGRPDPTEGSDDFIYDTELGVMLNNTLLLGREVMSKVFPHFDKGVQDIINHYRETTGQSALSPNTHQEVWSAIASYIMADKRMIGENYQQEAQRLLFGDNSLANRVFRMQQSDFGKTNYILRRLTTNIAVESGQPSTIRYEGGKGIRLDDAENMRSISGMLVSPDQEVRQLGNDLVQYAMMFHGQQLPFSYYRYIPVQYFDVTGRAEALRNVGYATEIVEDSNNITVDPQKLVELHLKHRPFRAPTVDLNSRLSKDKGPDDVVLQPWWGGKAVNKIPTVIGIPIIPDEENSFYWYDEEDLKHTRYISFKSPEDAKWRLYKYVQTDANNNLIYEQVENRGATALREYSPDSAETIFPDNKPLSSDKHRPTAPVRRNSEKQKPKPNPAFANNMLRSYIEDPNNIASMFFNMEASDFNKTLGNVLGEYLNRVPDIDVEVRDDLQGRMGFVNNTLFINSNLGNEIEGRAHLEQILLHEGLHMVTDNMVTDWVKNDGANLTDRQKKAMRAIETMYMKVHKRIAKENPELFKNVLRRIQKWEDNGRKGPIPVQNGLEQDLLYPVTNMKEFVAGALTNPTFQQKLNNIQVVSDSDKTVFDRIKELLADIIKSLEAMLGIDINEGSALHQTIEGVIELAQPPADPDQGDFDATLNDLSLMPSSYPGKDPRIAEQVEIIDKHIDRVKKNVSDVKKPIVKKRLEDRLEKLEDQKALLLEKQSVAAVREVAEEQIEWAKKIAHKKNPSDSDIYSAIQLMDAWDYEVTKQFFSYPELQNVTEGTMPHAYAEISGRANSVKTQLVNTGLSNFLTNIRDRSGRDVRLKDLQVMEEAGALGSMFLDISVFDNPLAQYMADTIQQEITKSNAAAQQAIKELTEKAKKFDDLQFLAQTDENGEKTGNLIDRYSFLYNERHSALRTALSNKLRKARELTGKERSLAITKAWRDFHNESAKIEHTIDIRFIVAEELGLENLATEDYDSPQQYKEEMKKELGEEEYEIAVDQAKAQWEQYKEDKEAFREALENRILELPAKELGIEEGQEQEYVEEQMRQWTLANSPVRYLDERFGRKSQKIREYYTRDGKEYTVTVPRRTNQKGEETGFYDPAYENLTKEQKEFHQDYVKFIADALAMLPNNVTRNLPKNFLPRVSKDLVETYKDKGMGAAVKYTNDQFWDSLTTGEVLTLEPKERTKKTDIKGNPLDQIPIRFVNKKSDPEKQSFNFLRIAGMFMHVGTNYKFKSHIEDSMNLGYRIIKEASQVAQEGGNKIKERNGELATYLDGNPRLLESVKYFLQANLYGKHEQEPTPSDTVIYKDSIFNRRQNNAKKKAIEQQRDALEEDLIDGVIDQKTYDDEMKKLKQQYEDLGGRNLVWTNIAKKWMQFTQMRGMGWNLTAGIANVGFGMLSNVTWAASGKHFNDKDLKKAFGIMLQSLLSRGDSKLMNAVKKSNILFEVAETKFGKTREQAVGKRDSKTYRFFAETMAPYRIQNRTEYFVQGLSMLAQMIHKKITVTLVESGETTEISLYDAFNKDFEWNREKYEYQPEWDLAAGEPGVENKMSEFRQQVIKLNKLLHGNYDPDSPIRAKSYLLGQMLLQFRSWIPYGFFQRFAKERDDLQLGGKFKGRYRTLYDLGLGKSIKGLFGQYLGEDVAFGKKGAEERLSEVDIANLKMNLREMHALTLMLSLGVMFSALLKGEDDDDPAIWTAKILMNQLYRTEQDIYFYLSPNTFEDITRNPLAIMKTYKEMSDAFDGSLNYIMDSDYKGERLRKQWMRVFPLASQAPKMDFLGTNTLREKDF